MTVFTLAELLRFTTAVLEKAGLDEFSTHAVAEGLCETSLRGVDSHGVRLLPHYVRSARSGRKNPAPSMTLTQTFPAFAMLDADNGFGHAAGRFAVDRAMEAASNLGVGAVAVVNSSHCGAMACSALRAARNGFMAFAFTHADSLLLSHHGSRSYFGTNPICFVAPRADGEPYCLDMATSAITWNRVLLSRDQGVDLEEGQAADSSGRGTTNARLAASLLPSGGYKGYGLASMVEVLCGVLTGMSFGRGIPAMYDSPMDEPRRLGQFYLVMRVDACLTGEEFCRRMMEFASEIHEEPTADGGSVLLPGDPEISESRRRREEGIPVDDASVREFERLAHEFSVPPLT